MRSGFKQSLAVMASMAVSSMMDWSKAYVAKAEELPPTLADKALNTHSFARKSRIPSDWSDGKRSRANRVLVSDFKANPMNYLPGRDTAVLMRIKRPEAMMKAAQAALDAYRENGFCLDKVQQGAPHGTIEA